MRKDIQEILHHIDLEESIKQFGELLNNTSNCVVKCINCNSSHITTIKLLKNRLSKKPGYLCNSCIGKLSWSHEKREKIQALWDNPEFKALEKARRKERWKDESYRQKMTQIIKSRSEDPSFCDKISEISKKNWKVESISNKIKSGIKTVWDTEDYKNKQSNYKTKEWRNSQSKKQKETWNEPGYRDRAKAASSEKWKDPFYKVYQSRIQKEVWERPGYREKRSNGSKGLWENPAYRDKHEIIWNSKEYKEKLSEATKNAMNREEVKLAISKAAKRNWENTNYRMNAVRNIKDLWQKEDYRNSHIQSSIDWWNNPLNKEKCANIRAAQSGKRSSIEHITDSILKSLGISFESQKAVGPYVFDFFLPNYDVYMECQGECWYSLPGRKERDAAKLTYLEKASPGSRIIYLNENEFLNPVSLSAKISKFLIIDRSNSLNEFNISSIRIRPLPKDEYVRFFNSYHYASNGRSGKHVFGAFLNDELVAAVKYSSIIRQEVATSIGMTPSSVLELDRFCIHPNYHKKNFASWFLSKSIYLVFKESNAKCLVSFADSTYGHVGTIYKASNWKFLGIVKPDYYYINDEGFILHKKTLYNRAVKMGKTEKEYAELHGYMKNYGREKYKYIFMNKYSNSRR